ncbi:hypothetical protein V5799_024665, partial [Amblyomma americanum]
HKPLGCTQRPHRTKPALHAGLQIVTPDFPQVVPGGVTVSCAELLRCPTPVPGATKGATSAQLASLGSSDVPRAHCVNSCTLLSQVNSFRVSIMYNGAKYDPAANAQGYGQYGYEPAAYAQTYSQYGYDPAQYGQYDYDPAAYAQAPYGQAPAGQVNRGLLLSTSAGKAAEILSC